MRSTTRTRVLSIATTTKGTTRRVERRVIAAGERNAKQRKEHEVEIRAGGSDVAIREKSGKEAEAREAKGRRAGGVAGVADKESGLRGNSR